MKVTTDHRRKIKASEKIDKYLDFARELKKLWNMKVTMISIVVGGLRRVPRGLEKRLEKLMIKRRIETMQTTAVLKSARIIKRVLETCKDLLSPVKTCMKNSYRVKKKEQQEL